MHLRKKITEELSTLIHQIEKEAMEEEGASRVLLYAAIAKIFEAGRLISDSMESSQRKEKEYRGRVR